MNLEQAQELAIEIKGRYRTLNREQGHLPWDARAYADGLVVDVAGLMKMLMVRDGLRAGEAESERFAHELSDIVWSAFAIADELGIDLAQELPVQFEALRNRFPRSWG